MWTSNFSYMVLGLSAVVYICATPTEASQLDEARSAFEIGEYHDAFQPLQAMANHGDPEAAFWTGVMWHKGLGTPQNYQTAVKYYRKGATLGNVDAQNNLGLMYRDGAGVKTNQVKALAWFKTAQISGSRIALRNGEALSEKMSSKNISLSLLLSQKYYQKAKRQITLQAVETPNHKNLYLASTSSTSKVSEQKTTFFTSPVEHIENGHYMVQLGVFGNLKGISKIEQKAAQNNISIYKEKLPGKEQALYRLRVGPFKTLSLAQTSGIHLTSLLGLKTLIVKGP
ncbi:MAG: hypothetical protein COB46_05980 [Rhodospirillaceae bacterium]|nr:MAG: hypothetical protein COB46_05980 [Rhodospirillaceae bacterium]